MSVNALRDINTPTPNQKRKKKQQNNKNAKKKKKKTQQKQTNKPSQTSINKDNVKRGFFYRCNVMEDISIVLYRPPFQSINTWYLIYTVIYPNTNILV